MVVGGADFSVKLVNTSSFSSLVFTGHSAPVLSVDLSHETLVSSSCDGSVRLWSVEKKNQIKILENVHKQTNDVPHSPTIAGEDFNVATRAFIPSEDLFLSAKSMIR